MAAIGWDPVLTVSLPELIADLRDKFPQPETYTWQLSDRAYRDLVRLEYYERHHLVRRLRRALKNRINHANSR